MQLSLASRDLLEYENFVVTQNWASTTNDSEGQTYLHVRHPVLTLLLRGPTDLTLSAILAFASTGMEAVIKPNRQDKVI